MKKIAILGGAGYVGSALTPYLLSLGYAVNVIDLFFYGERVFDDIRAHPALRLIRGDVRDTDLLEKELKGMDAVVHLACISNDPSFELDPQLGKSINYDAFDGILRATVSGGAARFLYASSSSVYGVSDAPEVREDCPCAPLTDYSKYKWMCEDLLNHTDLGQCAPVILRPATVCGYAPRLRLDLIVNILAAQALITKKITVHGGEQRRPNIHIRDMIEAYRVLLEAPADKVAGETFNVGFENQTVADLAEMVRAETGPDDVSIETLPVMDSRSYRINSEKMTRRLGFRASRTIRDAVRSLAEALQKGLITDPLNNSLYYNVRRMREIRAADWQPVYG
ncbi:NAD-dependent epimerase/dehydratase [bacterium]|nr:NAD-dependent epimerase/dehydratase [bacterium]